MRERIAKIVGLKPLALRLCWIKKGCVELHFLVSISVADQVFSVLQSRLSALVELESEFSP